jgi:hypothetical protein
MIAADWSGFLPSLIATLIGAGLGAFFALWQDRRSRAQSEAAAREQERKRLEVAIKRAGESINANLKAVKQMGLPEKGKIMVVTDLSTSVWEALKGDVIKGHTEEPKLGIAFAEFFHQVARLERLVELLRDYQLRALLQEEEGDARVTGQLAGLLAGNTGAIRSQGDMMNILLDAREAASPSSEDSSPGKD